MAEVCHFSEEIVICVIHSIIQKINVHVHLHMYAFVLMNWTSLFEYIYIQECFTCKFLKKIIMFHIKYETYVVRGIVLDCEKFVRRPQLRGQL